MDKSRFLFFLIHNVHTTENKQNVAGGLKPSLYAQRCMAVLSMAFVSSNGAFMQDH